MKPNILSIIISLFLLQSCSNEENIATQEIENLSLELSPPPIALDGIAVSFAKDISYGPFSRNTFDIFMPSSSTPTALVIYIHGGGFLGGEKENPYEPMWNGSWDFPSEIRTLLSNNIAFATINYRLLAFDGDDEGVLKSLNDSKRCLQFIRYFSSTFNINKANIVLAGSSAGAGTSQWLAFSDDMADLANADPILQQSTRVKAIAVKATQASYDLERYETDVFLEYNFSWIEYFSQDPSMENRFKSFYGINNLNEFYSDAIVAYREKVDMLDMMSVDDPEFWASNPQQPVVVPTSPNILNHHSFHARTLKQKADALGIPNVVYFGNNEDPSGEIFVDFMIRKANEN